MSELERRLLALREEVVFPPTPAFEFRLERRPSRRLRPLVVALAAVLLLAAGALALSPGARSAFLELFRLRGATIERTDRAPVFDQQTNRRLGVPVSLEQARRRARFRLLVPRGFAETTYDGHLGAVTFAWSKRRLLLTELRGEATPLVQKSAGPGTTVEPVLVNERLGYWLAGERHRVVFLDARGRFLSSRAAGNVLLWEQDGLLLRLEGARSLEEALAVAGTLRP